jgi:hypothetical protein
MEVTVAATAGAGDETVPSFESMLSQSNTVFCVLAAPTGIVLYVSPNSAAVLGIEPATLMGCARAACGGGRRGARATARRSGRHAALGPLASHALPTALSRCARDTFTRACWGVLRASPIRLPRALRRSAGAPC